MSVKFSDFVVETTSANVQYLVGYNGTSNVQITPNNLLSTYVPYTGATADINLGTHNYYGNSFFNGFTSIAASGTQLVLTLASAPVILVSGSGGQTIKLPVATTLPIGTVFSFNNNQSSGAILVNNNSNTLVKSVPSGSYLTLELTDNSTATGLWDAHFQAPSNASWSTNTLDWAGSITSATWNGVAVAINRGGTGATTAATALSNLGGVGGSGTSGFISKFTGGTTTLGSSAIYQNGSNNILIASTTSFTGNTAKLEVSGAIASVNTASNALIYGSSNGTLTSSQVYIVDYSGTNILSVGSSSVSNYNRFHIEQGSADGGMSINVNGGPILEAYDGGFLSVVIYSDGSIENSTGVYGTISDRTLKENITPATSKLDDLMKVNIVNYNLISDENKLKQIGVIAQELEEIFPGLVSTNKDGIKSVKTSVMIPILIKAVQELKQLIK
jgi:hypothetical protein